MKETSDPLLGKAIAFMYFYFRMNQLHPSLLPDFCREMPDDELLIRVLSKKDKLEMFTVRFNEGIAGQILVEFIGLLTIIENDLQFSLKKWKNDLVCHQ